MQSYGLKYLIYAHDSKIIFPALIFPWDSRVLFPTVYLTFPPGCLIIISNLTSTEPNSWFLSPKLFSPYVPISEYGTSIHQPFRPNAWELSLTFSHIPHSNYRHSMLVLPSKYTPNLTTFPHSTTPTGVQTTTTDFYCLCIVHYQHSCQTNFLHTQIRFMWLSSL